MKVIIPVSEDVKTSHLRVDEFRFASKAYIFDCDTNSNDLVPLDQLIKDAGNLTLELKSKGIFTVISPNMSYMSLSLFLDSQLQVYKANGLNLQENIQLYLNDQLEPYNKFSTFGAGGCTPTACGSCHDCN